MGILEPIGDAKAQQKLVYPGRSKTKLLSCFKYDCDERTREKDIQILSII